MNLILQKEIILQLFNRFGTFDKNNSKFICEKYLLDNKLSFEIENNNYSNNIWAFTSEIDGSRIQIIIGDLSEKIPEYCMIIKMADYPPYGLRISSDNEDYGSVHFKVEQYWVGANILFQSRLLVAIETLFDMFLTWDKNNNYKDIYGVLMEYIKFENDQNDE